MRKSRPPKKSLKISIRALVLLLIFCLRLQIAGADSVDIQIPVTCQAEKLTGVFRFSAKSDSEAPPPDKSELILKNGETGYFVFHPNEPGTWTYTISQNDSTNAAINYDSCTYKLILSVVCQDDGKLYPEAVLTKTGDEEKTSVCRFVNTPVSKTESTPGHSTENPEEVTPNTDGHTYHSTDSATEDTQKTNNRRNNKNKTADSSSVKTSKGGNTADQTKSQSGNNSTGGSTNLSVSAGSPKGSNSEISNVQTGDMSTQELYLILFIFSAILLFAFTRITKRQ